MNEWLSCFNIYTFFIVEEHILVCEEKLHRTNRLHLNNVPIVFEK